MSTQSFPHLSELEYPGRFILLGTTADNQSNVLAYAVTGRSPSSQARLLNQREDGSFWTEVTDPAILDHGNPALLLYPCLKSLEDMFLVSNGAQTNYLQAVADMLTQQDETLCPATLLNAAYNASPDPRFERLREAEGIRLDTYEPDAPTHTPRICGALQENKASLSIVRQQDGQRETEVFSWELIPGQARWITTYTGRNVPSGEAIPSFSATSPFFVELRADTAQELAEALYEALGPVEAGPGVVSPGADFRVGVLAVFVDRTSGTITHHRINRHERSEG